MTQIPPKYISDLATSLFGWLPTRRWIFILAGTGAILIALGTLVGGHHYFAVEGIPGFYGIFGFISFALLVLSGWPLRYLLSRNKNYYSDDSDDDHA